MSTDFANELWDQFEEVYKKVATGKEFATGIADFVHKRSAIEKDYARKLQALTRNTEKEGWSLMQGWQSIKAETDNIAKKHSELSESLLFQVEEPVQTFLKESRKQRGAIRDAGRKSLKDLQAAESRKDACKQSFEQARKKQDETKAEYEQASANNQQSPHIEKIAKKMKMDSKKAAAADKKYSESVDAFRHLQDKFYDEEMPRLLDDYYKMEQSRMEAILQALRCYVDLQRGISPEVLASCERMSKNVDGINLQADLQAFVGEKRTGAQKPDRCVYESYNPELQRCVRGDSMSGGAAVITRGPAVVGSMSGGSNTQISAPRPVTQPRGSPAVAPRQVAPRQAAAAPAPAYQGIGQCRALYDYNPDDANELAFREGDIITILQKDSSGWWQGELRGRIGVFPSADWVEEIQGGGAPPAVVPPPTAPRTPQVPQCRALYEYAAENEYEISISPGDVITVEGDEDGWYIGRNQTTGLTGRYPSNYVESI
eukprot:CAMPEP_0114628130 /NCGR_PEP_ID=MMETSP0168-20121206/12656_1 /TAXON_ID=95228 ORGANISM="Vannella sp., Strain DIVA3 517/6/12" /NCGR_SAMPLE_ID=MMETSP0168 /ASSEMBLY_ACC=CAM_ASM_000044 /LENGTH=486 /DNA_ID=CAMNT_0001839491 /DNA_START=9 /DNA_END=1469 /DNA_ORIENTATION=+